MNRRILLLYAHPAVRRSRLNRAMAAAAGEVEGVTVRDLYEAYPDFTIDIDREQELVDSHDVVVFQHPFFWYSAPAIVKEWIDLVLEHGWAYGRGGDHLSGKPWLQAITTGGRTEAYRPDGMNRFTIDELLRPFEATANLCRALWQPPFVVHAAHIAEATDIGAAAEAFTARLVALRDAAPPRPAAAPDTSDRPEPVSLTRSGI
jgi:glutathione-regulated potassium-efflux system ancillary protein KefG